MVTTAIVGYVYFTTTRKGLENYVQGAREEICPLCLSSCPTLEDQLPVPRTPSLCF